MNAISVFISYSHQDRAFVDDLAIGLQKAGVAVWYDPSLRGGDVWPQELADQIDRADVVVAVISAVFNQSDWARKEIVYAQGKKKRIVPFRLDAEPPIWLNDIQYVTSVDELLAALKGAPVPHAPRALKRTLPTHELAIEFVDSKDAPDDKPIPFVMSVTGTRMRMNGEFVSPLDPHVLADIRWYLELYPQWPSGPDYDRAQRIETNLPKWGEALLASLVKDGKVRDIYRQFERKEDVSHVLTITANEPRVLQLPWELLAEEGGFLFAKDISIRRGLPISLDAKESAQFNLPIRVLMVVSRPDDKDVGFLDPRSSAQALLDALDELGDAVEVDFLRPPTLAALDAALKSQTYHIVHFDGHGVYDRVRGLGLLLFERGDHSNDLVDANQFGTLMNQRNIPLVILDACQTAMQDKRELTSVAAKLIEAGVGSVLAMNYSVLVPTTRKFSAAFYHALANGATISAATEQGRRALAADKYRLSIYRNGKNEKIDLQDWFLPALYQQASDPALFARADGGRTTKDESRSSSVVRPSSFVPTQPERGGFPDAPLHGFKGRMRELLDLERLMLPSRDANDRDKPAHRIVVLHGWGGQGKTALATEAAHWFVRTGLFERAVFVSFEKGGGLELALGEMGNALVNDDFAIHAGDPIAAIETALSEKPTLVVWDNFESLISDGNAPLDDKALHELLDAGARWSRAGASRLLITTRDPDLPHADFAPSQMTARKELLGLAPSDALDLAGAILEDTGIEPPSREELEPLLGFLGGHPLSLHLVIPQLRDYAPARLIAEFDKLLPNFSQGAGKTKDESLRVSLEFSLNRLDAVTRARLPQLAVFQGGAFEPMIWRVTDFTEEEWARVRPQLARAALIRVEPLVGVASPYIHFHPTLVPYLTNLTPTPSLSGEGSQSATRGNQISPDSTLPRDDLRKGDRSAKYAHAYHALARQLYNDDIQHPHQARSIVLREMANLRRALALLLDASELDAAVEMTTYVVRFLDYFGRWRERDEVVARVGATLVVAQPGGKLTKAEFLLESPKGETLLSQGHAAEAESVFRNLLARMDAGAEYDTGYDRLLVLERLGKSLRAQGRSSDAENADRTAIAAAKQLEQTDTAKREIGVLHTDLAGVLRDLGRYDEARQEYEAALEIMKAINDDRSVAVILGQLGTLALAQGDLNEARDRYLAALVAFRNLGEEQGEAIGWHQLGRVAQEAREWDEAERCYKESLKIEERLGHAEGAAQSCNQLAIVAQNAGRPADAERWYRRAIELKERIGNPQQIASSLNNLADLLLAQGRLDEAERLAQRAREIRETLDTSSEIWKTHNILAQIAEQRGKMDDARAWRRKERESFAAFAGSEYEVREWLPLIPLVVAACRSDAEATKQVETFLKDAKEGWPTTVQAIRKILDGERGEVLYEGLTPKAYLIVRRMVEGIGQRTSAD